MISIVFGLPFFATPCSGARINKSVQICMEHQCPTMKQQWKPCPVRCTHGNMNLKGISFLAQPVAVELFLSSSVIVHQGSFSKEIRASSQFKARKTTKLTSWRSASLFFCGSAQN